MSGKITPLKDAVSAIDRTQELPFHLLHGDENITLILYAPHAEDKQTPHDQDEYYFVASGSGQIDIEGELTALVTGDAIFVPAHAQHHFLGCTGDFTCWALFYGPRQ